MKTEEHEIMWGDRLVKMMIFFDNVRSIPENLQQGKECCAHGDGDKPSPSESLDLKI